MVVDSSRDVVQVTAKASKITLKLILAFLRKVADTIERNRTKMSEKDLVNKAKEFHTGVEVVDLGQDKEKINAIKHKLAKAGIYFSVKKDKQGNFNLSVMSPYTPTASKKINEVINEFEDKETRRKNLETFKAAKQKAKEEKKKVMERSKNKQRDFSKNAQGGR